MSRGQLWGAPVLHLLALLGLVAALWVAFAPARLAPILLPLGYRVDGLNSLLAVLLVLAVGTGGWPTRALEGWQRWLGVLLLLFGAAQTLFATHILGIWAGLELAGSAIALLTPPAPLASRLTRSSGLLRHIAGGPLLAVGLWGGLDLAVQPGRGVPSVATWVVGALVLSAILRLLLVAATARPLGAAMGLYAVLAVVPLLHSLALGRWDEWGQLLVTAAGLALLVAECGRALAAGTGARRSGAWLPSVLGPAGALFLGLGTGTAAGAAGGLALAGVGVLGLGLAAGATGIGGGAGRALRATGLLAAAGWPPFAGFGGLWLLGGALLRLHDTLGLLLLVGVGVVGARWTVNSRQLTVDGERSTGDGDGDELTVDGDELTVDSERSTVDRNSVPAAALSQPPDPASPVPTPNPAHRSPFTVHRPLAFLPLLPVAGAVLLGGLAPAVWWEGALRPALEALAAGVPPWRLPNPSPVPGLGYGLGEPPTWLATWPVLGVAVALALAWLAVEVGARVAGRVNGER